MEIVFIKSISFAGTFRSAYLISYYIPVWTSWRRCLMFLNDVPAGKDLRNVEGMPWKCKLKFYFNIECLMVYLNIKGPLH